MKRVLYFALGATAGSLVTWFIVKEKYKRIADEEIASVVEHYHNKLNALNVNVVMDNEEIKVCVDGEEVIRQTNEELVIHTTEEFTDEEREEYAEQIEDLGYSDEAVVNIPLPREYTKPYVISPDEYGEMGYMTASLTLYDDGVLVDDADDEIISNPEDIIGDALSRFGEYEDDAIHVRDENVECDYEILKSEKTFSEVYKGDN